MAVSVRRREILRTHRLRLTSWMPVDALDLAQIHADAETMRFVRGGRPETYAETKALIGQYIDEDARTGLTKWRLIDLDGVWSAGPVSANSGTAWNWATQFGGVSGAGDLPPRSRPHWCSGIETTQPGRLWPPIPPSLTTPASEF